MYDEYTICVANVFVMKVLVFIFSLFSRIVFPKYGCDVVRFWSKQGIWWIINSIWFQKILGFNRFAPYPMHFTTKVSNYSNLILPVSSFNNLHSRGTYFQNFGAKIYLGENVYIGPNVGLITSNHNIIDLKKHRPGESIRIGDNSWIGMNTVILPGVCLADNTIVAAGSVVNRSFVESNIVLAGSPAKIVKRISYDSIS